MLKNQFHWGILGPGRIAHSFMEGIIGVESANIQAVASRNKSRAGQFAEKYNIPRYYDSYEELVADNAIDIIYVATPHSHHYEHVMLALSHGKHVLCEKPLTLRSMQARTLFEKASMHQLHLMEAMWSRFLPVWQQMKQWIDQGMVGEVRMIMADFAGRTDITDPNDRILNKKLAGGALYDIGVYPIALAQWILPSPIYSIKSHACLGATGVDMQSSYLLSCQNGAQAILSASFEVTSSQSAVICGTKGRITVPSFWKGDLASIVIEGKEEKHHFFPMERNGMQYQCIAMMDDIRSGKLLNNTMSPTDSIEIASIMQSCYNQWEA